MKVLACLFMFVSTSVFANTWNLEMFTRGAFENDSEKIAVFEDIGLDRFDSGKLKLKLSDTTFACVVSKLQKNERRFFVCEITSKEQNWKRVVDTEVGCETEIWLKTRDGLQWGEAKLSCD